MQVWKDAKMVIAGKKAAITKLKQAGKIEEARKAEEALSRELNEVPQRVTQQARASSQKLREVKVGYSVPFVKCPNDSLPWVEKHRPVSLKELVGPVAPYLRAFIMTDSFPLAMVFHGDFGDGKTAAAKAFIRDYYVHHGVFKKEASFSDVLHGNLWSRKYEGCWSPVLSIDATITPDVEAVKQKTLNFMKVRSMWNDEGLTMRKMILFDEADRLGYAAQGMLRSLIEKYPRTVTVYTSNRIDNIDPAIVSRASGGVFEFTKPDKDSLASYLEGILHWEKKKLKAETIEEIAVACGSVREAVGRLQQEVALSECAKHGKH